MKQNEINSWGVVQMYKPYRCKEGMYDGKKKHSSQQIKLFLSVIRKKCILHWKNI